MKVNQEEVAQLRQEIKITGQIQAMEEKQRELEKIIVMKLSINYVTEEDMKRNVTEDIKTRLQEKEAEEKARKDKRNNIIFFGIEENQATNKKDKQTEDIKETSWVTICIVLSNGLWCMRKLYSCMHAPPNL